MVDIKTLSDAEILEQSSQDLVETKTIQVIKPSPANSRFLFYLSGIPGSNNQKWKCMIMNQSMNTEIDVSEALTEEQMNSGLAFISRLWLLGTQK